MKAIPESDAAPVVVYDACVLYPSPLRDLLAALAQAGLCRARWTERIDREWVHAALATRPELTRADVEAMREELHATLPGCLVEGYEEYEAGLALPDPDDRHVLAAAVHSSASLIVTRNLRDFSDKHLQPHNVLAVHPDHFVTGLIADIPDEVCAVVESIRARLRNPAMTTHEYQELLKRQALPRTVKRLRELAGSP